MKKKAGTETERHGWDGKPKWQTLGMNIDMTRYGLIENKER